MLAKNELNALATSSDFVKRLLFDIKFILEFLEVEVLFRVLSDFQSVFVLFLKLLKRVMY